MGLSRWVLLCCSVLALVAQAAEPDAGVTAPVVPLVPAEVIRYRQSVMRAIASQIKALGFVAARKVNYPKNATLHANAIAELSKVIGDLFPKGTGAKSGETDAMDAIWKDPKAWTQAVGKIRSEADKLQATAIAGDFDAMRAQLEVTNDACAACHKSFRANR